MLALWKKLFYQKDHTFVNVYYPYIIVGNVCE